MGHKGGGGHQSHNSLHNDKNQQAQAKLDGNRANRKGMSRTQYRRFLKEQKKGIGDG